MKRWMIRNKEWLFSGIGIVIGTFLMSLIFSITSFTLSKLKSLELISDYIFSFQTIFFLNLLSIFLVALTALVLSRRLPIRTVEPNVIFSNKIIFRKVRFGARTQHEGRRFALSIKVLITNNVQIFNTKLSLIYMHYERGDDHPGTIERHGVEEFTTTVNYVDTVHRYSFFSDELSYRTLKPISEPKGSHNYDRIVVVLTGFHSKHLRPFIQEHQYSFEDIKFADTTPKVVTYKGEERKKMIDLSKFHEVNYLTNHEVRERKEELQRILEDMYVKPDP